MSEMPSVYIFKVALKDSPKIWRRIAIRDNQSLDDLHEAIFVAFDREEEHLYSFYFPRRRIKGRPSSEDFHEYTHPFILEDEIFGDKSAKDASRTRLRTLGLKLRQQFDYMFDFGDSWWHELTVENLTGQPDKKKYPRILEKHGESPLQYEYDE